MKFRFKYYRDKNTNNGTCLGLPRITVADLYDDDGDLRATGYAFCSMKDNPTKKLGHQIAAGRAYKAYLNGKSCGPIMRAEALEVIENVPEYKMLFRRIATPLKSIYHNETGKKIAFI